MIEVLKIVVVSLMFQGFFLILIRIYIRIVEDISKKWIIWILLHLLSVIFLFFFILLCAFFRFSGVKRMIIFFVNLIISGVLMGVINLLNLKKSNSLC